MSVKITRYQKTIFYPFFPFDEKRDQKNLDCGNSFRLVPRLHSNSPQPNKELSKSPSGRLRYIIKSQIVMNTDTY